MACKLAFVAIEYKILSLSILLFRNVASHSSSNLTNTLDSFSLHVTNSFNCHSVLHRTSSSSSTLLRDIHELFIHDNPRFKEKLDSVAGGFLAAHIVIRRGLE